MNSNTNDPRPLIEAVHIRKSFPIISRSRSLKSAVIDVFKRDRAQRNPFEALRDVTFTVGKGETVGIIGLNGAGKSTLLALIAGTMQPTSGSVQTRGTVSSLLELGAGFHPDLSGRENVFLYGAIMGISRAKMKERFDAIVAFSELSEFIDRPVKHYSSGMYVRLGFAVAVEVDPDVLLIDEVLAVGDTSFQRKCLSKMREFREQGKSMLIVSHDLATVRSISDRILLLDHGKIIGIGAPDVMVDTYQTLCKSRSLDGLQREWGTGEAVITQTRFLDDSGLETDKFQWGQSLKAEIHYKASRRIADPVFGFSIADRNGLLIYGSNTQIEGLRIPEIEGEGCLSVTLRPIPMAAGTYLFSFSLHSADHKINYHRLDNAAAISITSDKTFEGACYIPCQWAIPHSGGQAVSGCQKVGDHELDL